MKSPHDRTRLQVAALPVRDGAAGREIMLITSRDTGRWIVPKGWPMKGRRDHRAAAIEALQEAGIRGKIGKHPIGTYLYDKREPDRTTPCRVTVYLLDVEDEHEAWREDHQRVRRWFPPDEAAALVSEPELASMIRALAEEDAVLG